MKLEMGVPRDLRTKLDDSLGMALDSELAWISPRWRLLGLFGLIQAMVRIELASHWKNITTIFNTKAFLDKTPHLDGSIGLALALC